MHLAHDLLTLQKKVKQNGKIYERCLKLWSLRGKLYEPI